MTEAEWLASANPIALLAHLNCPPGTRKHRLYAVACCRLHWHLLTEPESREGVEWAERFADELVVYDEEYRRLDWYSEGAMFGAGEAYRLDPTSEAFAKSNAAYFAHVTMIFDKLLPRDPAFRKHRRLLSVPLLRDIFGNPFPPVAFDPSWRTEAVVGLARGMYEARDFAPMPILADALEDAGCDNADVLAHCRGPGPHVRGCWVVDLVLGKG